MKNAHSTRAGPGQVADAPGAPFPSRLSRLSRPPRLAPQEGTLEFGPFRDFEARFGPPLPALGLEARILLAEPAHGCTPLKNRPGHRWVALIERSPGRDYPAYPTRPDWPDYAKEPECKFIDKVQNAEAAGAAAVIIYDNLPGEMFIMAKPYDAPEPRIPAVSISKASGLLIKGVLEGPHTIPPFVLIMPDPAGWASLISVVMAGVLCMSLVVGFFFYRQHQLIQLAAMPLPGRPSRQGMAKKDIEALPLVRYTGPEPGDEDRDDSLCVICLDDYKPDELLRMLPCRHKFHRKCIDKVSRRLRGGWGARVRNLRSGGPAAGTDAHPPLTHQPPPACCSGS